ncbi:hypothetical protein GOBAR_DD32333 [Gossypium barbadense]|nr:hypothetical protein GOBAR_DD32333 [Gossypium barbadense]
MTRDTHARKNHDEISSDDKEKDATLENIAGMVKFQHQQLNELTQVVARLETSSNRLSRARDIDDDRDNE